MKQLTYMLMIIMVLGLTACTTPEETDTSDPVATTEQEEPKNEPYTRPDNSGLVENTQVDLEGWKIVWNDEFDYEGLPDSEKWGYDVGGHGWGNQELQYYTENREENAVVNDGFLTITAREEYHKRRRYTSARLLTKGKFEQEYGRIEARIKLPGGQGLWPAFWMLGSNYSEVGWPQCGEIDIMENVGYEPSRIHGTVHGPGYSGGSGIGRGYTLKDGRFLDDFHTFYIEWEPGEIRWYMDGILYNTLTSDDVGANEWVYDHPFFIIMNIAVGGQWPGSPDDATTFPQEMKVDYVRVYQKDYPNDTENPSEISNLTVESTAPYNTEINWTEATDNNGILRYDVYLNDTLVESTTSTKMWLKDLDVDQTYTVKVKAIDVAENESLFTETSFTTAYASILSRTNTETYLENSGMEFEDTNSDGGVHAAFIDAGDYLTYKINVEESGTYTVNFNTASIATGKQIELFVDDQVDPLTTVTLDHTGDWQRFTDTESATFNLEAGVHTIKIHAKTDGFNINWFEFSKK